MTPIALTPIAWWSPTHGYLVPAVGRGEPPLDVPRGRVKRVSDNYVVPVPDDAVELTPLDAIDPGDVGDALCHVDVWTSAAMDGQIAEYLTERRRGAVAARDAYEARLLALAPPPDLS